MSLCKKTTSLYAGSHVPIRKIYVPIRRGPCTRASLVQGLLEDPGGSDDAVDEVDHKVGTVDDEIDGFEGGEEVNEVDNEMEKFG